MAWRPPLLLYAQLLARSPAAPHANALGLGLRASSPEMLPAISSALCEPSNCSMWSGCGPDSVLWGSGAFHRSCSTSTSPVSASTRPRRFRLERSWGAGSIDRAQSSFSTSAKPGEASKELPSVSSKVAGALGAPPQSLEFDRGKLAPPPILDNALGRGILWTMGFYSRRSRLLHGGQILYDAIKEQVDDGALHRGFGMDPTVFYSTYILLALHVWLIIRRLKDRDDKQSKWFKQRFYMLFMTDTERRVYQAGVQMGVLKWAIKMESAFYNCGLALDKVLDGESSETFADVILREFLAGDPLRRPQAEVIAKYIFRELRCLELTDDETIFQGNIKFSRKPFE